jgi:hypothetical protein
MVAPDLATPNSLTLVQRSSKVSLTALGHRRTLMAFAVFTCAVISTCGGLVAGAAPARGPSLNLPMARQAFDTTWPSFSSGFAHKNLAKVNRNSTGEMEQAVVGYYSCGCATWVLHDYTVRFSVPIEQQYPLSFLAEVAGLDVQHQGMVEEVVLTKSGPSDRWRVAYMVAYEEESRFLGSSALRAAPPMPFDITRVGTELSHFFQTIVNTGTPPADDSWPLTGPLKQQVYHDLGVKQLIEEEGDSQQSIFVPTDHSSAFSYPSGDIMCGAIDSSALITTPTGYVTVQPANRSNWGSLLAPGAYSSLTKTGVEDYCFTATTGGLTTPISFFGGINKIVGSSENASLSRWSTNPTNSDDKHQASST